MNKFEYKNLTPFKWFVLENFPFIEADFDALTNWQLFCKLGNEMNKIINSENTLGTQVENVTNAFIELKNYIDNYFKNLNVQNEIDVKLDEMAKSGELAELINVDIFGDIINNINNLNNNINNLNNNKINKNGVEEVEYKNLSQEIKEKFTGGSVAVVGIDSVSTSNIVNNSVTPNKLSFIELNNLIDTSKLTLNKYQYNNEQIENNNYCFTDYIEIENKEYICNKLRFADFYNESKIFISGVSINNQASSTFVFTPPENAKYIVISYEKKESIDNYLQLSISNAKELGEFYINNNIDINALKETTSTTKFNGYVKNLNNYIGKYVEKNGYLNTNVNYFTTPFLDCQENDNLQISIFRTLCFYDEKFNAVSYINNIEIKPQLIVVPEKAKYVRISYQIEKINNSYVYSTKYLEFLQNFITTKTDTKNAIFSKEEKTLNANTILNIVNNLFNKKNYSYNTYFEFENFSSVEIGQGKNVYNGGYIKIDNENIYIYYAIGSNMTPVLINTIKHNLSIEKYLNVNVQVNNKEYASIIITTTTGQFVYENELYPVCNGDVYLISENILNNIRFSYISNDLKTKIYMFGDSYFSLTSSDRWVYYLVNNNYNNLMLNGYSGCNSQNALNCLNTIISSRNIPDILVWCLGMNDGDTEDTINTNYKNALEQVINICNQYNINLILSTIPNTPTINNFYKNEYVKSLKYRYIDFAKAVGAELKNSNWYTGCLSSDNVHPTILGAKLLYAQALNDVPEIIEEN